MPSLLQIIPRENKAFGKSFDKILERHPVFATTNKRRNGNNLQEFRNNFSCFRCGQTYELNKCKIILQKCEDLIVQMFC